MALKQMRIMELGYSSVGKTTYMASMYGTLQRSFGGFRLQAVDQQEHSRLSELYGAVKAGFYPLPTSQRSEYDFYLQHHKQNALRFTWADYRGGAICDTSDDNDVQRLLEDLGSTDGIMIFFDAGALARTDKKANEIGRITYLLGKAFRNLDRPISLAIVLTKIDLLRKEDFHAGLLESLKGLIEVLEASNKVSGTIIPVACGTKMINTQLPVLFVLQTRVRFIVDTLNKKYQKYKEEAEAYQKEADKEKELAGGIRDLWRKSIGETTHEELAQRNYQWAKEKSEEAQAKLSEWQPLVEPANDLDYYTRRLIRIRKGETLQSYATQLKGFEGWGCLFIMLLLITILAGIAFYLK